MTSRRVGKLTGAICVSLAFLGTANAAAGPADLFTRATGAQEIPGPGDPNGFGAAMIDIKQGTGQVCIGVRYRGLNGPNAMHIHTGAAGESGPIVVNLTPALTGGQRCVSGVDPELLQAIMDTPGAFYLNIHTGDFAAGATRGQLERSLAPSPFTIVRGPLNQFTRMSGRQEVGGGDPNGSGTTFVDLRPGSGQVCADVRYRNIDAPTTMHIHNGTAGTDGPIVVNLTPVLTGTRCVPAPKALIEQIRDAPAQFYCNVHTEAFPDGAIRGQNERSQP